MPGLILEGCWEWGGGHRATAASLLVPLMLCSYSPSPLQSGHVWSRMLMFPSRRRTEARLQARLRESYPIFCKRFEEVSWVTEASRRRTEARLQARLREFYPIFCKRFERIRGSRRRR